MQLFVIYKSSPGLSEPLKNVVNNHFFLLLSGFQLFQKHLSFISSSSSSSSAPSAMSDSDDDVPTLSAHTLAALQEFYSETRSDPAPSDQFAVGAVEEDWVSSPGGVKTLFCVLFSKKRWEDTEEEEETF